MKGNERIRMGNCKAAHIDEIFFFFFANHLNRFIWKPYVSVITERHLKYHPVQFLYFMFKETWEKFAQDND